MTISIREAQQAASNVLLYAAGYALQHGYERTVDRQVITRLKGEDPGTLAQMILRSKGAPTDSLKVADLRTAGFSANAARWLNAIHYAEDAGIPWLALALSRDPKDLALTTSDVFEIQTEEAA